MSEKYCPLHLPFHFTVEWPFRQVGIPTFLQDKKTRFHHLFKNNLLTIYNLNAIIKLSKGREEALGEVRESIPSNDGEWKGVSPMYCETESQTIACTGRTLLQAVAREVPVQRL